jgi:hypothetical protein
MMTRSAERELAFQRNRQLIEFSTFLIFKQREKLCILNLESKKSRPHERRAALLYK